MFERPIRVRLHRIVPFWMTLLSRPLRTSLPRQVDFQKDYDGDATKAQTRARDSGQLQPYAPEHIRNANSNLPYKPSTAAKLMTSSATAGPGRRNP